MPKELANGKPTTRRYSSEEKAAAVRMVRTLRAELGVTQGTVQRVATQLGYGVESVRMWVKQADIDDGVTPGVSSAEAQRVRELEQENRELRRANEVLKRLGIRNKGLEQQFTGDGWQWSEYQRHLERYLYLRAGGETELEAPEQAPLTEEPIPPPPDEIPPESPPRRKAGEPRQPSLF